MVQFDDLSSILTRYQNHVGEYDKAKWEHTVEQRILHGINHIPTKSAKLQSELIDLDLVRGSSFSKAKPKHGVFTVIRQASLRFFFLPIFHEWWSSQTSPRLFVLFIVLYVTQIVNLLLYWNCCPFLLGSGAPVNSSAKLVNQPVYHGPMLQNEQLSMSHGFHGHDGTFKPEVQSSEILSPLVLMIILTILHSQIVATHSSNSGRFGGGSIFSSHKPRQKNGGGNATKQRSKRRLSRHHPRRKSNTSKSPALTPPVVVASTSNKAQGATPDHVCSSTVATGNKKVLFEDESKSWTSSNSDKDEGIAEEYINENHDSGENEVEHKLTSVLKEPQTNISEKIIEANVTATVKAYLEDPEEGSSVSRNDLMVPTCHVARETTSHVMVSSPEVSPMPEKRSNLRKRNLSKMSEASTTSFSCADCSSNNNDSTSDEDGTVPADLDDDDVRSKSEWTAVTTNSEDEDYGEEIHSDDDQNKTDSQMNDHPFAWEFEKKSTNTVSPSCASSDKVSCTIWVGQDAKKADLTVLDISSSIIGKVECIRENSDYLYLGICFSCILAILPCLWRLRQGFDFDDFELTRLGPYISSAISCAYGEDLRSRIMILISVAERLCLGICVFFLLAVAEKTYKQRFLYAKLFSRLTSSRKAKKSGIPHFRLNKVRNIKTWLSVRSYLRRRGPQRSVNIIVSATFIAALILIFFLSVELLKDSNRLYYLYNVEVIAWCLCLGIYLMRFMTLGSRISQKYRNLSVIITEQLNLYLKMEQKPHKKEELLVANNVLKLAAELLKELEDPFKISSFATNPYLYNVTRLVILSAFSGVLSEMLGFKLKLYKIKIK
ncbi:unnamed protein product [Orchesella dallaii]|uniref:PHTF1/2 N-terminal domain-containing protein n=1 Tax=Orchesella dallaii TaxID=48710 RepID=A0ABP1S6M4_9HEXA